MSQNQNRWNSKPFYNKQSNSVDISPEVKKCFKEYPPEKLLSEVAEKISRAIFDESNNNKLNKNTQIRKFFDELAGIKLKLDVSSDSKLDFEKLKPIIFLLASKAAYAKGRRTIGDNLYEFFKTNVLKIGSYEDLKLFLLFFEAILGYYKYLNPKES